MNSCRSAMAWAVVVSVFFVWTCSAQSTNPTITLLLNSGTQDPIFQLTDAETTTVADLLQGLTLASDPAWSNLGWRGFEIDNDANLSFLPLRIVVFNCIIQITDSNGQLSYYQDTNGALFAFLAGSIFIGGAPSLSGVIYVPSCTSQTEAFIPDDHVLQFAASPWPTNGSEPAYNPNVWNAANVIRRNNCYNYATNMQTNTFAQPGRAAGRQYTAFTCGNVGAAARADGLTQRDCTRACPADTFKVALVMDTTGAINARLRIRVLGPDYHWYQQNDVINGNTGYFSHKPGPLAATDRGSAPNPMLLPTPNPANQRQRLGIDGVWYPGYTQFCDCYCVDPATVRVR